MVKKKRSDSSGPVRTAVLPIRYSKKETFKKQLDDLVKKEGASMSEVVRSAVDSYFNLKTKSWADVHHEIVEKARLEYVQGLKANGYDVHDVTAFFIPDREGWLYLIRKHGVTDVRIIMPPPFLGNVFLCSRSGSKIKIVKLVPDVFEPEDIKQDTIGDLVKKLEEFVTKHRNGDEELITQFSFHEHLSEFLGYIQTRSIESHVIGGPVPSFPEVVSQETATFSEEEAKALNRAFNDLKRDLHTFATKPPQNMHLRFIQQYGELDIKKSEIVALVAFLPSKLREMIRKKPNELMYKVGYEMKKLVEQVISEFEEGDQGSFHFSYGAVHK